MWVVAALASIPIGKAVASGYKELLPSFDNPKLSFETGKIENHKPQISTASPAISGVKSPWAVQQWQQNSLITGVTRTEKDQSTADPFLGRVRYAFTAPDGHSHVWIYENNADRNLVYDLYERNGWVTSGGGSNIFLAADTIRPAPTFDHRLIFSMLAKVSKASISFNTPIADTSGAVLALSFTGFVIQFPSPVNGSISTMFLQLAIASSQKTISPWTSCLIKDGRLLIIAAGDTSKIRRFAFQANYGPLQLVSYNLNDHLNAVLARTLSCQLGKNSKQVVSLQKVDLASAKVTGVYIGLETQNTDKRARSKNAFPQGNAELSIQISDVKLEQF